MAQSGRVRPRKVYYRGRVDDFRFGQMIPFTLGRKTHKDMVKCFEISNVSVKDLSHDYV